MNLRDGVDAPEAALRTARRRTDVKPRVTIEELSRLIDGELSDAERTEIERRLAACPVSQALKQRLEQLTRAVSGAILETPPAPGDRPTDACLNETTLVRLADGRLAPAEKEAVEDHVLACERCLLLVLEHLRTAVSMQAGAWPKLPPAVEERQEIRALVNVKERDPSSEAETKLAVDLTRPARATETFGSGDLSVDVVLRPLSTTQAHLGIAIKERLRAKKNQEVVITDAKTKRKFFTGLTNAQGHLEVRRLPAGRYIAHFAGNPLKLELVLTGDA